jgi:hypothetical protein
MSGDFELTEIFLMLLKTIKEHAESLLSVAIRSKNYRMVRLLSDSKFGVVNYYCSGTPPEILEAFDKDALTALDDLPPHSKIIREFLRACESPSSLRTCKLGWALPKCILQLGVYESIKNGKTGNMAIFAYLHPRGSSATSRQMIDILCNRNTSAEFDVKLSHGIELDCARIACLRDDSIMLKALLRFNELQSPGVRARLLEMALSSNSLAVIKVLLPFCRVSKAHIFLALKLGRIRGIHLLLKSLINL